MTSLALSVSAMASRLPQCRGPPVHPRVLGFCRVFRATVVRRQTTHRHASLVGPRGGAGRQQRSRQQTMMAQPSAVSRAHSPRGASDSSQDRPLPSRRSFLQCLPCLTLAAGVGSPAAALEDVRVKLELAPDQGTYDPSDERLRRAARMLQEALNAESVEQEEALWTKLIDEYGSDEANWADDVVGRALGNRGNARARQGQLEQAIKDYNAAIARCPWSVDPVLNRGVAYETLQKYPEAKRDYTAVLEANPNDAAAWNNLGNVSAAASEWEDAYRSYDKAVQLAPQFSFAAANRALALFEAGNKEGAIREIRALLRRYPDFPDMRAALTAALWSIGKEGEAESNWGRVSDVRYKDLTWLVYERRWPPSMVRALSAFLNVKSV